MQLQIYNKKTQELIAWLDTVDGNVVVNGDYGVKTGSNLLVTEGRRNVTYGCIKGNAERKKVYITG